VPHADIEIALWMTNAKNSEGIICECIRFIKSLKRARLL